MTGPSRRRGSYLVLEGGDASGKSIQAPALRRWLEENGHEVVHLREPGSTSTGEALRQLLLDPETGVLDPWTEALLFSAARAEMIRKEVAPALAAGAVVLVERCYLSTMVYQSLALPDAGTIAEPARRGLLQAVTEAVHGTVWPDRIFLLDVDEATRQARAVGAGKVDRFESRSESFHQAVREAYLALAGGDDRVDVVDARPSIDSVQAALRERVSAVLREVCT